MWGCSSLATKVEPTATLTDLTPPIPDGSSIVTTIGTALLLIVGALVLAYVARLLNHTRRRPPNGTSCPS